MTLREKWLMGTIGLLVASNLVSLFLLFKPRRPFLDGDAPVTIGDSSLHGRSKNGWNVSANQTAQTLVPNGASGAGQMTANGCNLSGPSAVLELNGGSPIDVSPSSPSWQITIQHKNSVNITLALVDLLLTISGPSGSY